MKFIVNENVFRALRKRKLDEEFDLSSFQLQDTLCPDIFDENNQMHPEVRKNLLQVGMDFYDFCNIEWVDIEDIILTGSLANYNWSQYSDVDLHVVLPYKEITKNSDLAEEFGWTKKTLWNNEHDVYIKKFPIELYLQDSEAALVAGGIYSVLHDKWIKFPEKQDMQLDERLIQRFIGFFESRIRGLYQRFSAGDTNGLLEQIDAIKRAISGLRKKGLNSRGEFSAENIAFKGLRRLGLLDTLDDMKADIYDSNLSYAHEKERPPAPRVAQKPVEPKEDKTIVPGEGRYFIMGRRFTSLRQAEKKLGIPKSTLQYRVKSDSPEFSQYKEIDY